MGAIAFLLLGRGGILPVGMNVQEVVPEDIEVTFTDVKGCDEAKKELEEIVEFLMKKYIKISKISETKFEVRTAHLLPIVKHIQILSSHFLKFFKIS